MGATIITQSLPTPTNLVSDPYEASQHIPPPLGWSPNADPSAQGMSPPIGGPRY
jgi:hypothetical protein